MKRMISLITLLTVLLSFAACGLDDSKQPITELTNPQTAPSVTEPSATESTDTLTDPTEPSQPDQVKAVSPPLTCEGKTYDNLNQLIEALADEGRMELSSQQITIEGLSTPLTLYLNYGSLAGYIVRDHFYYVEEAAWDYTCLYGMDVYTDLFQYGDAIILNIWDNDYTLIITPNGSWSRYPENGRSLMVYRDSEDNLVAKESATKFPLDTLEQYAYAPLERATSRDDFFYATGSCTIKGDAVLPNLTDVVTISDVYDLDALFAEAQEQGLFSQYDTLDTMLECNARPNERVCYAPPLFFEDGIYSSLDELMQVLNAQGRLNNTCNEITIEGLITPVTFYLDENTLVGYGVYGYYFDVNQQTLAYTNMTGNVTTDLFQYGDALVLNIWHDFIGYTLIMTPEGGWVHYPFEGRSLMVHRDEVNNLVCTQFSTKFNSTVYQWVTAPLDLATSRDEFYYATGTCTIEGYSVTPCLGPEVSIGDVYDLDVMFETAKYNGYYGEFDTVDELLAYNYQQQNRPPEAIPGD